MRKLVITNDKTVSIVAKAMGFFISMPIMTIPIGGGRYISIFTFFLGVFLVLSAFGALSRSRLLTVRSESFDILFLLGLSLISAICGMIYFSIVGKSDWIPAITSPIPKIGILLILCLLWPKSKEVNVAFIQGCIAGCIANSVWSIIDAAGYYITGKSIGNIVFSSYANRVNRHFSMISIIDNSGLIRASGFNDDPASLGFYIPIIVGYAIYHKKYFLLFIGLASIVSSSSTTSLVGSIFVIALYYIQSNRIKNKKHGKGYKATVGLFVLIIVAAIVYALSPNIRQIVEIASNKAFGRMNLYVGNKETIRVSYARFFPLALTTAPFNLILGTGWGASSYAYVFNNEIVRQFPLLELAPFDPENTYINILLDVGIIGLILFIRIFRKSLSFHKLHMNEIEGSSVIYYSLISMISCALFYHYILYTPQYVLLIVALEYIGLYKKEMGQGVEMK